MVTWNSVKLESLMRIETGSRNTEDRIDGGHYPFFVRSQQIEHIDDYAYDCEAVLTAGDGVGTGKVFHYVNGKFDAHQRVYVMSQFNGIDGKFFYYYFSRCFFDEVSKYTAKSSVDSVRRAMIADMEIPLPPLPEQHVIAAALSDTDAYISALEKLIAKKRAVKQGAMQELLTGKRRLAGFEGEWTSDSLGNICVLITDGSHESPLEVINGYYMPSVKDMTDNGFDFSGCKKISQSDYERLVKNGCRPQINDVVIAKDGSILKYSFVIKREMPVVILSSIAILRPDSGKISCEYLAHYFRQPKFIEYTILNYKTGTGVPRIVLKNFKEIPIEFPQSKAEQTAIAAILSDMDTEIEALTAKLEKARRIKQGMMSELLTGRIRLIKEDTDNGEN